MPKLKTRMNEASRKWWIWGALGVVTVIAGAVVFQTVFEREEQDTRTVGSMLNDHPHPFEDQAAAGQNLETTPTEGSAASIYTSRMAELATILGLSDEQMYHQNWPEIVLTIDNENRAAMRMVLEDILNEAVQRGDISYVDRDRVLYTFDLGLIDAPLSAITKHPGVDGAHDLDDEAPGEPQRSPQNQTETNSRAVPTPQAS